MITSSTYHAFTTGNEEQTAKLVEHVLKAYPVEHLYLLGLTLSHRRTESLFTGGAPTARHVSHYYLLALVEKNDEYTISCITDKIENNLQHFIPCTVIVRSVSEFNNWLIEGHPFAGAVVQKAQKLYSAGHHDVATPAPVNQAKVQNEHTCLQQQTTIRVQEFLAAAELFHLRKHYPMAVFMLHQAAEQALRTLLIIHTGLRINTHSIDRLIRLCAMFNERLPGIFPNNTEKERRLAQLLQKAYIHARYNPQYTINCHEENLLAYKVKEIVFLLAKARPTLNETFVAASS